MFLAKRKIIIVLIVALAAVGGYFGYKAYWGDTAEVRYVLAAVTKGTLITSVFGSGQISASNQIDITPKISGDLVYVGVKTGEEVKTGTLIGQLDSKEAQKSVRDAESALESAKLSLEKLKKPADELSILQAENSLAQAKESKQKADDDLVKAYEDGFNDVANVFLDLPTVMSGLNDILFGNTFNKNQDNLDYFSDRVEGYDGKVLIYKNSAKESYETARTAYDENFNDYKATSRFSTDDVIESLIDETYETTKNIAEAVKDANNLIQFYADQLIEHNFTPETLATTYLSDLNTYTGQTNNHLSNLLAIERTIQTDKETIINADRTIAEKTGSLADLKAGADELDIKSSELTIKQKENALLDAKEKYADYYVRAPFDGVMVAVDAKKGDTVSSATVLGTLITKQKIAEISLNEVDAAKVKTGQKATLTFDAVEELSIAGEVAEIDAIGTVSQGVVTYNVKIVFDTQDERVKPGMSVSASIVTEVKLDTLSVPNAAVKQQNDVSYVEAPGAAETDVTAAAVSGGIILKNSPERRQIEAGISNDEYTEVLSGLSEGDIIIVRTIQKNSTSTTSSGGNKTNASVFGISGGGPGMR
ncbi:MAG: efflux RND transporter periplasmic adaptor subunit [Patescibacteria group bacterium]|nr:efflux RND transporter periplasmic adaptor subunit [Patescibacteria group bacterium]MDD5490624.1 efflux RND transporter periplasmic adaptor subunit [Patescibacteria group bacterium]